MVAGRLYWKENRDLLMRLCIDKDEAIPYLECAHIAIGNMHLSPKQTQKRTKWMGFYLPTVNKDVFKYNRECTGMRNKSPIVHNAISLYKMSPVAPKWTEAMVEYMTTNVMPKKMSKVWQRYLQKHSQDYCIIANQLYHQGRDGSLRICGTKAKYLEVLFHAHSCLPGDHFFAEVTAKAIMQAGLWWPTLFKDANKYVWRCDECQRYKDPIRRDEMPLRPMMGARAFAKWGIDFVGHIDPPAH